YFTVERSADGLDFEFLTYLDGAGNSNSRKEYSFIDTDPLYGTSYYRLKQTDYDGNAETFPMVAVVYELEEKMSIVVYPNPTHGKFWVDVEGAEGEEVLVVVLDMWGREHYSKIIILEDTGYTLAFDPYGKLSAGVYLIVGSSNNRLYSKKLIIR
ncbi:MAG: T9SS type A sorting domain-containing protein, partial [Flavobacteriales bacterium]|nr:T9SS type A sorting domain-containing protein [Flavobacteriales bacterium]